MYFESVSDFLSMDGHGQYVWMCYGAFVLVILWNVWLVKISRVHALKRVEQHLRREQGDVNREHGR